MLLHEVITMILFCPNCKSRFEIDQPYPYHAGFSNVGFLYCECCPAMVTFHTYDKHYTGIVGDKHPWDLNEVERRKIEESLKPCPNGGRFRFNAYPRCPVCNEPMPDLLQDRMHFIQTGEVFDSASIGIWDEHRKSL